MLDSKGSVRLSSKIFSAHGSPKRVRDDECCYTTTDGRVKINFARVSKVVSWGVREFIYDKRRSNVKNDTLRLKAKKSFRS